MRLAVAIGAAALLAACGVKGPPRAPGAAAPPPALEADCPGCPGEEGASGTRPDAVGPEERQAP